MRAFVEAVAKGGPAPISFESLRATSLATFGIRESLSSGLRVPIRLAASVLAVPSSAASLGVATLECGSLLPL